MAGCVASATLLLPSGAGAQGEDLSELVDRHRAMTLAMRTQNDNSLLAEVALASYVVIPPGGIIEKREQALRGVRNFDADSVQVDVEVAARHDNTVILIGTVAGNTRVRGPVPQFGTVRFMAVYVWTEGRWRLLASSNTPCHERAIRAGRC